MIDAEALHEAEQQALGQVAQMDLSLAARLHELAMNAEDTKEIVEFVRSYQRASRCVRQTIMLRARLRRDHDRHVIATTPPSRRPLVSDDDERPDPIAVRIDGRIMDLQEAASRIVAEASPDLPPAERAEQLDRIDAWIDLEVEAHEDFGVQDLDDHVLELCRAAGLPEALGRRFRNLPRAPRVDEGDLGGAYDFPPYRETG